MNTNWPPQNNPRPVQMFWIMCTQVLFLHVWLTHLLRRTRQTLPPKVSGKQKVIKQNMGGHISTIILLIYLSIRLIRLKNTIAFSPKLPPQSSPKVTMIKPASGLASPSGLERLVQLSKVTIWNRVKKAFQILQGKMMGKALGWGGSLKNQPPYTPKRWLFIGYISNKKLLAHYFHIQIVSNYWGFCFASCLPKERELCWSM